MWAPGKTRCNTQILAVFEGADRGDAGREIWEAFPTNDLPQRAVAQPAPYYIPYAAIAPHPAAGSGHRCSARDYVIGDVVLAKFPFAGLIAVPGAWPGAHDCADMAEEAINTPFFSLQEKLHTVVLRGLRNISEAPYPPPMNFLLVIYIWPIFRLLRHLPAAERREQKHGRWRRRG